MTFYDLPKAKIPKRIYPLQSMSKKTAFRKFLEKMALKKELEKQLRKCEKDLTKYYLTYSKNGSKT